MLVVGWIVDCVVGISIGSPILSVSFLQHIGGGGGGGGGGPRNWKIKLTFRQPIYKFHIIMRRDTDNKYHGNKTML